MKPNPMLPHHKISFNPDRRLKPCVCGAMPKERDNCDNRFYDAKVRIECSECSRATPYVIRTWCPDLRPDDRGRHLWNKPRKKGHRGKRMTAPADIKWNAPTRPGLFHARFSNMVTHLR